MVSTASQVIYEKSANEFENIWLALQHKKIHPGPPGEKMEL